MFHWIKVKKCFRTAKGGEVGQQSNIVFVFKVFSGGSIQKCNINCFNTLLNSWSRIGKLEKIYQLYDAMCSGKWGVIGGITCP
ncbi:hypothetical protein TSUD_249390 [Trifolium subterraneum]|nr:hypothetical protein TSUD_249390 [Trifolium subterraneum]